MSVSSTYDAAGRLTLLENRDAMGLGLAIFTSTYDALGNRVTALELDGTRVTYSYDGTYQLVNEQRSGINAYNTTYTYDGVGNRLIKNDSGQTSVYSYNGANELTLLTPPTGQPTTSSYDANGNLTLENAGGSLTTYSWDTENRLTRVAAGTSLSTYAYSADGLRKQNIDVSGLTYYIWDDRNLLIEENSSLTAIARNTDYPGYWGGLTAMRRSSQSSFYGYDPQGSARILVSLAGVVTDSYSYKAFGEELASSGSTSNPFRFEGLYGTIGSLPTEYMCGPGI